MDNYGLLLERISGSSGLGLEELGRMIEAKRAKLSGLVSKEGAAQIVAAELGINFDQERVKLSELVGGMKRANVFGKVIQVFPVREYNKNGRQGKVANFLLADDTSNVRAVLWDMNHISLIEKGEIKEGDVIEVSNANVRNGELHLSSFADVKKSKEKMGDVVVEKVFGERKLIEARVGDKLKTRAFILQIFDPRYFEVNAQTGRRVSEEEIGKVEVKKRALLNLVLDDGTETLRCVLFGEQINKLGLDDEEIFSLEKFAGKKESLLGEEMIFSGGVRNNSFSNTQEMIIEEVKEVDPGELVKELEGKG